MLQRDKKTTRIIQTMFVVCINDGEKGDIEHFRAAVGGPGALLVPKELAIRTVFLCSDKMSLPKAAKVNILLFEIDPPFTTTTSVHINLPFQ